MLDVKLIRDEIDRIRENIKNRGVKNADPDRVVELYGDRNRLVQQSEDLRKQRNENSRKMKGQLSPEERAPLIESGKKIKEELSGIEERLHAVESTLEIELRLIPNLTHPDVPIGGEHDGRDLDK